MSHVVDRYYIEIVVAAPDNEALAEATHKAPPGLSVTSVHASPRRWARLDLTKGTPKGSPQGGLPPKWNGLDKAGKVFTEAECRARVLSVSQWRDAYYPPDLEVGP